MAKRFALLRRRTWTLLLMFGMTPAVLSGCEAFQYAVMSMQIGMQAQQLNNIAQDHNRRAQEALERVNELPSSPEIDALRAEVAQHAADAQAKADEAQKLADRNKQLFEWRDQMLGFVTQMQNDLDPLYEQMYQAYIDTPPHSKDSRARVDRVLDGVKRMTEAQLSIGQKTVVFAEDFRFMITKNPEMFEQFLPAVEGKPVSEFANDFVASSNNMLGEAIALNNVTYDVNDPDGLWGDMDRNSDFVKHTKDVQSLAFSMGRSSVRGGTNPMSIATRDLINAMKSSSDGMRDEMITNEQQVRRISDQIVVDSGEAVRKAWQAVELAGGDVPAEVQAMELGNPFEREYRVPAWNSTFWDISSPPYSP